MQRQKRAWTCSPGQPSRVPKDGSPEGLKIEEGGLPKVEAPNVGGPIPRKVRAPRSGAPKGATPKGECSKKRVQNFHREPTSAFHKQLTLEKRQTPPKIQEKNHQRENTHGILGGRRGKKGEILDLATGRAGTKGFLLGFGTMGLHQVVSGVVSGGGQARPRKVGATKGGTPKAKHTKHTT